jgi:hypothetical protein
MQLGTRQLQQVYPVFHIGLTGIHNNSEDWQTCNVLDGICRSTRVRFLDILGDISNR